MCRLALTAKFLSSYLPNCDLGEFQKAMFHGVVTPCDLIFYLVTGQKFDFGIFDNAMFSAVSSRFQIIFCLFEGRQWNLGEDEKVF
jgi:hypothetical protein